MQRRKAGDFVAVGFDSLRADSFQREKERERIGGEDFQSAAGHFEFVFFGLDDGERRLAERSGEREWLGDAFADDFELDLLPWACFFAEVVFDVVPVGHRQAVDRLDHVANGEAGGRVAG